MELQRYWNVVRKRFWLIALITIAGTAAAGYYANAMAKPQYEAAAKLIVGAVNRPDAQAATIDVGSINSNLLLIKTYKEIIRTPRIMDLVVQRHPELRATTNELIAKVTVTSVNDSQVMSVIARDDSYARAARIANAVSDVFRQEIPTLMNVDNVSILHLADPEERRRPVTPPPEQRVAVAFVVAALVGIGLAFVLERLDDTVKTERDVRLALGLPVLAAIPKAKRRAMRLNEWSDSSVVEPIPKTAELNRNVTFDT